MGKKGGTGDAIKGGLILIGLPVVILFWLDLGWVVGVLVLIIIAIAVFAFILKVFVLPWEQKKKEREEAESLLYFKIGGIDHLTGEGFEELLKKVFTVLRYNVQITKKTGDQGADLILSKDGRKISVQAKRYSKTVGNKAIQEVYSSIQFYETGEAWVITTSGFTKGAIELARRTGVKLYNRYETINLIKKAHAEIKKRKT